MVGGRKSELTDEDVDKLYRQARRKVYGPAATMRKLLFIAAVLALGLALVWLYQSGLWAKAPLVRSLIPPPSDEEIIANLSAFYSKVEIMTVKGNSMFPYLVDGQKVFVATDYYKSETNPPMRDDVVAVSFSTIPDQYVKRVVFVPQDSIAQEGGTFRVKDSAYNRTVALSPGDVLYKQLVGYGNVVPNGTVVVLGDNPQDKGSVDSRSFGLVLISELSGKVVK